MAFLEMTQQKNFLYNRCSKLDQKIMTFTVNIIGQYKRTNCYLREDKNSRRARSPDNKDLIRPHVAEKLKM